MMCSSPEDCTIWFFPGSARDTVVAPSILLGLRASQHEMIARHWQIPVARIVGWHSVPRIVMLGHIVGHVMPGHNVP